MSAPRPTSCHLILRCASAAPHVRPCKHGLPSVPASCPPSSLLGQAFVRLVAVSSIHYCTSTPALSTSSSSRGLIVFKGTYLSRRGGLILEGASRLDAFSVYPFPAWLPSYGPGGPAGAPEAGPPRSSRTKGSSPQTSCAHAG